MRFVSLHQHTEWSNLDGLVTIKDLVARAKEYGEEAVAITDHGCMTGAFKFYEECKAQGIKPIIGEEFYISKRRMTDKEPIDRERFHLTVLAKNMTGLRNLFKLTTLSHTEGFYYKNRIDEQCLFEHKEGLIVLSGCHSSKISQFLIGDPESGVQADPERATKIALAFKKVFGEDFYLEIQTHGLQGSPRMWTEQQKLNKAIIELSKKIGVKVVLTADSHYLDLEETDAHEVLLCVGTASRIDEEGRMSLKDFDLSFPNPVKIEKWLMDEYGNTEYADNTIEVADKVNIEWEYGSYLIPKYPTGELTEEEYIKKLIWEGLKRKVPNYTQRYIDEIKTELKVLGDKGYLGYFLIVQDYVNWAKNQGISVGASRGSACGCLIAYLLNITEIDPLQHNMLFERFMNPERPSAPDIDVDFQDDRREEVVKYVTEKYGKDCVCNILILNYMKSKSVFKDVSRTFNMSFQESNEISALIPQDIAAHQNPLIESLNNIPELKELYAKPHYKEIFDFCLKLEGKPRNHGVHACGVIIAPSDLTDYIPLEVDKDGKIVSGFPPEDLEKLGLLKMDFLGLSTLTVIANTLKYIPELNSFYEIPQDDEATFNTFCEGKSYRTFQFKTPLARETCIKMNPRDIQGLSDVTAIARPGPMQQIPVYERRRKGLEKVEYISPIAEKYFSKTYGLNIYQEQGMQYLQEGAGFSKAEADFWRKGVAKAKYKHILDELYPKYMEGCKRIQHMNPKVAEKWWNDQIEGGAYTFNLCLSGDTIIDLLGNSKSNRTVEEMYNIIHSTIEFYTTSRGYRNYKRFGALGEPLTKRERGWHQKIIRNYNKDGRLFPCQSVFNDNRVHKNHVLDIRQNGIKPVYKMILSSGKFVKCTSNHKIFSNKGLVPLSELSIGDKVHVKGEYEITRKYSGEAHKDYVKNLPKKGELGFQETGDSIRNYKALKCICREYKMPCMRCGCEFSTSHEAHHIDKDHSNDSLENLVWLCNSCHKVTHYEDGRVKQFEKGVPTVLEEIVAIEYVGEEMTYDVEVADPAHNFLVNGGVCVGNSHSYAYAWLGYITCYLLTHYPKQYLAAEMNNVQKDKDKLAECFEVCKILGISILPPDASKSGVEFVPTEDGIVYGLSAIHGMGATAEKVVEFFATEKPKTLEELLLKAPKTIINKTRLRGMICAGALDCIEPNRWGMIQGLESILKWRDSKHTKPLELEQNPNANFDGKFNKTIYDMLKLERETTGRFMTKSPLEYYGIHGKQELQVKGGVWQGVIGIAEKVEHRTTKNGWAYDSIEFNIGEESITLYALDDNVKKFKAGEIYRVNCMKDLSFGTRHKIIGWDRVTPNV